MIEVSAATGLVRAEWTRFVATLAAAGPDVWERPTRLAGWTVEDLARHVHWGTTLEADGLRLASAGAAGPAAGTALEGPRDGIVPALHRAVDTLVQLLERVPEPATGSMPMPYGELPMALALQVFVMEAAMHGSDLADAVGAGRDTLPAGTHESCAAVLQAFLPALAAGAPAVPPPGTTILLTGTTVRIEAGFDGSGWGPPAGEPSVVVEGSDDAVLLYAYGRVPLEEAGLGVTGDRELAARLKEFLPGP